MKAFFEGDARVFICINTADFNGDGNYAVVGATYDELEGLGISLDEAYAVVYTERMLLVDDMSVGDIVEMERGDFLMRVA